MKNVGQNADAFHHLSCTILHQAIVSGNVGLTFRSVDDQCFNFIAAALQFYASRETSTAQSGNAELMNTGNKLFSAAGTIVSPAFTLNPAIFAISIDYDAELGQC